MSLNAACTDVYELYDDFMNLFSIYERDYKGEKLSKLIREDWLGIFSDLFDLSKIDDFLNALIDIEIYDRAVPPFDINASYRRKRLSLNKDWENFSTYLQSKGRFIIADEYLVKFIETLPEILSVKEAIIPSESIYFRARLNRDKKDPFDCSQMGTPPQDKSTFGGRANPPGIPFLYLSEDDDTAIAEVRPWAGARVSVANFALLKQARIVDLTIDLKIRDPFDYQENLIFAMDNCLFLERLGAELSKPISPGREGIEYVPTQYLSELIRNNGYDGLIYPSALGQSRNLVCFNPTLFRCLNVKCYIVNNLSISTSILEME